MKNAKWTITESLPGEYTQLRLFAPTQHEILLARVIELEAKLDRQRKGQFGKIGRVEKTCKELIERLEIIERGICQMNECKAALQDCQIMQMAVI